jgi:hypothetical protein
LLRRLHEQRADLIIPVHTDEEVPLDRRVTLLLPDETYRRAEELARLTDRAVGEVLADTLRLTLPSLETDLADTPSVASLSDEALLALTKVSMPPREDRRFSELLRRQQAGASRESERSELQALLSAYQAALLRKARALNEAVRRGLLEPLAP